MSASKRIFSLDDELTVLVGFDLEFLIALFIRLLSWLKWLELVRLFKVNATSRSGAAAVLFELVRAISDIVVEGCWAQVYVVIPLRALSTHFRLFHALTLDWLEDVLVRIGIESRAAAPPPLKLLALVLLAEWLLLILWGHKLHLAVGCVVARLRNGILITALLLTRGLPTGIVVGAHLRLLSFLMLVLQARGTSTSSRGNISARERWLVVALPSARRRVERIFPKTAWHHWRPMLIELDFRWPLTFGFNLSEVSQAAFWAGAFERLVARVLVMTLLVFFFRELSAARLAMTLRDLLDLTD